MKMNGPYQFKNLENQGINVGTNSEPYFYEKLNYFYYLIGQFNIFIPCLNFKFWLVSCNENFIFE